MRSANLRQQLIAELSDAGCVAADEEADELIEAADGDWRLLAGLAGRRVLGEPLAWITGSLVFLDQRVKVTPGVYVPRRQSELIARRAIDVLDPDGVAVDLCTGSGAIAMAVGKARPAATVVATDLDPLACACATANSVTVFEGHLADPLPQWLRGCVDVITAVVPYVPTESLGFLPRDVRDYEPILALDGGPGGTRILRDTIGAAAAVMRPGGTLLLELGGEQDRLIATALLQAGLVVEGCFYDDEGDLRGLEATSTSRV